MGLPLWVDMALTIPPPIIWEWPCECCKGCNGGRGRPGGLAELSGWDPDEATELLPTAAQSYILSLAPRSDFMISTMSISIVGRRRPHFEDTLIVVTLGGRISILFL
jgi:hypothetical protein